MKKWLYAALIVLVVIVCMLIVTTVHHEALTKQQIQKYLINYPNNVVANLEKQCEEDENRNLPSDTVSYVHLNIIGQKLKNDTEPKMLYGLMLETRYYLNDEGVITDEMSLFETTSFPVILHVKKSGEELKLTGIENAYYDDGVRNEDIPEVLLDYIDTKTDTLILSDYYGKDKERAEKYLK